MEGTHPLGYGSAGTVTGLFQRTHMDYTVIARAGLHKTEFAIIAGVARASLHEYIRGRRIPHHLTERQLMRVARMLDAGIEKGMLPPADT